MTTLSDLVTGNTNATPELDNNLLSSLAKYGKRAVAGLLSQAGDPRDYAQLRGGPGPVEDEEAPLADLAMQNRVPLARQMAGVEGEGATVSERAAENIPAAIANIPLSGGPVGQLVNAGIAVGLPEGVHQLIGSAQAQPVDDGTAPTVSFTEPETAPFAPMVPDDPNRSALDQANEVEQQRHNDEQWHTWAPVIGATVLSGIVVGATMLSRARTQAQTLAELTGYNVTPRVTQGNVKQSLEGLETGLLDRNAPIKNAATEIGGDAWGKDFANQTDLTYNPAAQNIRVAEVFRTGALPGTNLQMTPLSDWFDMVGRLAASTPTATLARFKQMFNRPPGAVSELADASDYLMAQNELNVRLAAKNEWINKQMSKPTFDPTTPVPDIKPNMWDHDTPALEAIVAAGNTNPKFVQIASLKDAMMDKLGQFLRDRGVITDQLYRDMRRDYPNYVPLMGRTDDGMLGALKNAGLGTDDVRKMNDIQALLERSWVDEGGILKPINAFDAIDQYTQTVLRWADENDLRSRFFKQADVWQNVPSNPKVFTRVGANQADAPDVMKYTISGKDYFVKVEDPNLLNALKNGPLFTMPFLNTMRKIQQQTITGAAAPWFAPVNNVYTGLNGTINRPAGTAMGLADKALQSVSGGALALRGDPTALLTGLFGSGVSLYGHVLEGARATLNRSLLNEGFLVQRLGEPLVRRLADAAADAYSRSTLHSFYIGGMGTGSAAGSLDTGNIVSTLATLAPQYGSSFPMLRKMYNIYDAIIGSVHNGGDVGYYWLNKGNVISRVDERQLAAQVRNLVGDPARSGSNSSFRALSTSVPYMNVTMQGIAAMVTAAKNNPLGFAGGVGTLVGLPAFMLASGLANLSFEDRQKYFMKSSDQRTSQVHVPVGGDPDQWPALRLPPEVRPLWAAAMTMIDGVFGLSTGAIDNPEHAPARQSLTNLSENQHWEDNKHALWQMVFPGAPGVMQAGLAAAGAQADLQAPRGTPSVSAFGGQKIDNVEPDATRNVDDIITRQMETIVDAVIGTVGQLGIDAARGWHYAMKGSDDVGEALRQASGNVGRDVANKLPGTPGLLWSQPSGKGLGENISTKNADADLLATKVASLKTLTRAFKQMAPDGASPEGGALPIKSDGITDPRMLQAMASVNALNETVVKPLMKSRGDAYAQLNSLNGASTITAESKREMSQALNRNIQLQQRLVLERITDFEDQISRQFGTKLTLEKLVGQRQLPLP